MGVRVRPTAEERVRIEAHAEALGVGYPFEGTALRLVMGSCVFYAEGCQLHAAYGPEAKPAICQQFPHVRAGPTVGVDPACAHWTSLSAGEAPLGVEVEGTNLLGSLEDQGAAFGWDLEDVASRWREAPWALWADSTAAGPIRRETTERLRGLTAPQVWPEWEDGARAVDAVSRLRLAGDVAAVWAGAVVIGATGGPPEEMRQWLAVWVRCQR